MSVLLYFATLLSAQAPVAEPPAPPAVVAADAAAQPASESSAPASSNAATAPADSSGSGASTEATDAAPVDEGSSIGDALSELAQSGALGLMLDGGLWMWPILLMGILAAGIIIERFRSLKMLSADPGKVRDEVTALLRQDRIEEALQLCDREQGPVPAILGAGLREYLVLKRLNTEPSQLTDHVLKAMDDYGVHVVAALEKHLPLLATVSSAAPMVGFLGTVAGMITSFREIVAKMGETNIVEAAAGGIEVALLTTAFGLIVGIPAYVAFNYFTSIVNAFVLDVEQSASDLIREVRMQLALQSGSSPA